MARCHNYHHSSRAALIYKMKSRLQFLRLSIACMSVPLPTQTIEFNFNLRFLLAQLHIDSLTNQPTVGHTKQALQNLPKGLDQMYAQAMKRIESQGEGFRDLAKKVLSWVIHAKRTLSTAE